jgi:putative component of toxin-antitoxin plasmid stabilization module
VFFPEVGMMGRQVLSYDVHQHDNLDIIVTDFSKHDVFSSWKADKDNPQQNNLIYIHNGKAECVINERAYRVKQGNIIYTSENDVFELRSSNNTAVRLYSIGFHYSYLNSEYDHLPLPNIMNIKIDIPLVNLFEELNEIWTKKGNGYRFKAKAVGLQIIYEILFNAYAGQDMVQPSSRIDIIKRYIATRYYEDMRVADLANLINLNPVYFGAYFKKKTGYTVNQYINYVRVSVAKELLASGYRLVR